MNVRSLELPRDTVELSERDGSGRNAISYNRVWMSLVFMAADLVAVLASFGIGFLLVNIVDFRSINFKSFVSYWMYLPLFILALYILRLYPGVNFVHAAELRRFAIASFFGHAGILIALVIQKDLNVALATAFGLSLAASLPAFMSARGIVRKLFIAAPFWGIPVVVIGGGHTGRMIVDRFTDKPSIGFRPIALLDDDPDIGDSYRGVPIYTGLHWAGWIRRKYGLSTAIVAMPGVDRVRLERILAQYAKQFARYMIIPDFFGVDHYWMSVRDVGGVLGLSCEQNLLKPSNLFIKRCYDFFAAFLGLIALIPLFAILSILIAIDSPGPVFYSHERLGQRGKPFRIFKFRTMRKDSARILAELLERDPAAKAEWDANFKLQNDPRITRVGRFLRKTSLDELPQLWNVLKGQMSLVGPRPIIQEEVDKYGKDYEVFSSVKPGMTGLWQISGRSEIEYAERVALDVFYISSWSVWTDLYILFKTVGVVLGGRGAV